MNFKQEIKEKDIFKVMIEINTFVEAGDIGAFSECELDFQSKQKFVQLTEFRINDPKSINEIIEVIKKWDTHCLIT
jgi:hypothetical protein